MEKLMLGIQGFIRDEEGVTMIEYGLIAALIAIVVITMLSTTGNQLNVIFQKICNGLKNAAC